jgi:hypothetical protein
MGVRCARMAAYGLAGAEPAPTTPRQEGRFARGRYANDYFVRQMRAKHGEENIISEMAVPWPAPPALPIGELHVDCAVISERLAIEVKNSVWIDSLFDSAVLQVAGAVHYSDRFDAGLVVFLDHDLQVTHEFPVFLNDELIEKVESIAEAVLESARPGGAMPERICEKPADGIGHFCPFIDSCFGDDWDPEPARVDEQWSELASRGWVIQRDLQAAKGKSEELQAAWDAWKEEALALELPLGETMAGPIRVKRIEVKGRETFSKAKAVTAGAWTPLDDERLGPFVKIGEPSYRFDLQKTEADEPLDLDFGEEAPF